MSEKPEDLSEIGKSNQRDLSGNITTATVQTRGRIEFDEEWLDEVGVEIGDDVLIKHEGDQMKIMEASADNALIRLFAKVFNYGN
jgi:bifunctional DNA-binding transcriptional regulator/antitoxin component of YhaV-PrlF toxin-antitoxin module